LRSQAQPAPCDYDPPVLGPVDHVGYLAADIEASVAEFTDLLGAPIVRRFERPQYSLQGVYLGAAHGDIEIYNFTDPELNRARLGDAQLRLDHVAYEVADIEASAAAMRRAGVRFSGPDLREELHEAVDLGGVLHLWTVPESCFGQFLQLMQR
jgi:catechol 2,3-dioxygenase-like lactoylglutathione lyase family enzyme